MEEDQGGSSVKSINKRVRASELLFVKRSRFCSDDAFVALEGYTDVYKQVGPNGPLRCFALGDNFASNGSAPYGRFTTPLLMALVRSNQVLNIMYVLYGPLSAMLKKPFHSDSRRRFRSAPHGERRWTLDRSRALKFHIHLVSTSSSVP